MKRMIYIALWLTFSVHASAQWVQKMKDGSYTVDTSVICDNVMGYNGPTPVTITIKNDKIVSVVLQENQETYKYIKSVEKLLLPKYEGKPVSDILKQQPDGVTGATYTSKSIKRNIAAGLEEYRKKKKYNSPPGVRLKCENQVMVCVETEHKLYTVCSVLRSYIVFS